MEYSAPIRNRIGDDEAPRGHGFWLAVDIGANQVRISSASSTND